MSTTTTNIAVQSFRKLFPRLIHAYVLVPIGCIITLAVCWGIDALLRLGGARFPASVLTMLVLSIVLMGAAVVVGERKVNRVVKVLDIPLEFASRHISIVFTPSFVLLPLSPTMGGKEAGMVIAVFVIGFIVMFVATTFGVQGLQALLGTEKARARERQHEEEQEEQGKKLPLVNTEIGRGDELDLMFELERMKANGLPTPPDSGTATPISGLSSTADLLAPAPTAETSRLRGMGPVCGSLGNTRQVESQPRQYRYPLVDNHNSTTKVTREIMSYVTLHTHSTVYGCIFLFVGIPMYYTTGYTMPLHISITALAYHSSLLLPAQARKFLHPVLATSGITLLVIYLFALTNGVSLNAALHSYSTGTRYLQLFHRHTTPLSVPGAGDILASLLDVSIISLSLPVYHHRHSLRTHLLPIAIPSLSLSLLFLFLYPPLTSSLAISAARAKAFVARSVTLALATPAVVKLDGDVGFTALLTIMSGIMGVLLGPKLMTWCKVRKEDYVTWGVVMGANAGAIGTAWLLGNGDPRAAAVATIAMVGVGVGLVVLTSLPGVKDVVDGLVGA